MQDLDALRYPIGAMPVGPPLASDQTQAYLADIAALPQKLAQLVAQWPDDRLDTPYRPEGWTVRQVVHHVADSHMNAYIRTKLALTEENPRISPYEEGEWAKLPDAKLPVAPSLTLLAALHKRWVVCLEALTSNDLRRTYYHPGSDRTFALADVLALYAWHGEHHYQHISRLAERNGWT
ncbi:putative metal-dependent hydrolase [Fibrella sp. HMF5335]|uniref:Metal-dependent hydrolase n=1 Tax=Fibrella rubiginis TaxID=2817060 RepID=A0A939K7E6_9BACT|nr:putative metal-dependent hydrolase [Fibrella rubiginis]MBO0939863.1 putative metal-dependent hydrolase [Fibrella rubiginis]